MGPQGTGPMRRTLLQGQLQFRPGRLFIEGWVKVRKALGILRFDSRLDLVMCFHFVHLLFQVFDNRTCR